MGVVAGPSAVTGLAAMSIMAEMTFIPGRHSSSKFSHTEGALGLAWRLISNATVLFAMIPQGRKAPILLLSLGTTKSRALIQAFDIRGCSEFSATCKVAP